LAGIYTIGIAAYAIMSNHYYVVIYVVIYVDQKRGCSDGDSHLQFPPRAIDSNIGENCSLTPDFKLL